MWGEGGTESQPMRTAVHIPWHGIGAQFDVEDLTPYLKVHKNENFYGFDFEFCTILMLFMHK